MKGILGKKVGMTQIFDEDARVVPVTVVKVAGCRVGQVKTLETDGYEAMQLCLGEKKRSKATKPEIGHAKKYEIEPARHTVEVRSVGPPPYESGQSVTADIFADGDLVDVVGVSKGKGFTGVMKRHNFAGQRASHGAHRIHRHPGSIGMCATPSRVFKGKRMAGRHGAQQTTVHNLTIVAADPEREIILLKGAVPGPKGGLVLVRGQAKKKLLKQKGIL